MTVRSLARLTERGRRARPAQVLAVLPLLVVGVLLASCAAPENTTWQALDTPAGSKVISLAVDPSRHDLVYAGATGAVYRLRSTTAARPLPGAGIPPQVAVNALLPDPQTRGTLYAATTGGLYITTDSGDHWQARGSGFPADDGMDALTFGAGMQVLLAGSAQHGTYLSHDGGATWSAANSGLPAHAHVSALLRASAGGAFFAAVDGAGLFTSADGGQTWQPSAAGLPAKATIYALAELPAGGLAASGPTLYAGTSDGLFASADGGHSWSAPATGAGAAPIHVLAADPARPGTLYAGTEQTVLRSTDGWRHWSEVAPGLAQQVNAIVTAPQANGQPVVFAAADRLRRYPAFTGRSGSPFDAVANILLIAAVLAVAAWAYLRSRRRLTAGLARSQQAGRAPRPNVVPEPDAFDEKTRANGHRPLAPGSTSPAAGRSEPEDE